MDFALSTLFISQLFTALLAGVYSSGCPMTINVVFSDWSWFTPSTREIGKLLTRVFNYFCYMIGCNRYLVSSTKMLALENLRHFSGRWWKRSGPKNEPWGMPYATFLLLNADHSESKIAFYYSSWIQSDHQLCLLFCMQFLEQYIMINRIKSFL